MRRTYLYRAYINKETQANCDKWLEICRTLYNLALEQRINIYKQWNKSLSTFEQIKQLPELKEVFPEFKIVSSQTLQDVIERLDRAFQSFFQRLKNKKEKAGFPRFKGKNRYDSFTLKQAGWRVNGKYLFVRNVGKFKLKLSRPIEGKIKTITIRKTTTEKYFVAFSCDDVPVRNFPETTFEIGIDVGIKSFCVGSNGERMNNPRYFRNSEKLLRKRQRSLSRKKKGSNRRYKARILVAKAHEKIADQRKDFLHKLANFLVSKYKKIFVEELDIKGMMKNRYVSKSISDASWGMFFNFLFYKAEEAGRTIVKVKPQGTSQICSGCGEKIPKSLSVRIHKCPFCNLVLDRDENASLNILRLGQSHQALTSALADVV